MLTNPHWLAEAQTCPIKAPFLKIACIHAKLLQSCLTLCDAMDCSPPRSSVHGILQARILEWVAIPFSGGSSQPRDGTCISFTGRGILCYWATREAADIVNIILLIQHKTYYTAFHLWSCQSVSSSELWEQGPWLTDSFLFYWTQHSNWNTVGAQ